ncbi:MAG TPA: hypothetical protein VG929_08540 [Actinomycetota bacterium]|nr:hypothetical protein [Actinomycetota bacterium]
MKKTLALSIAMLTALALFGAPASAGKKKKAPPPQEVEGSILFPARHPDGCYAGLQRHFTSLTGQSGIIGYTFDVEKTTWKKPFKLEVTGGFGYVDLDIVYYLGEFHDAQAWVNDPLPAAPASVTFEERNADGEKGAVPDGAVKAIVCMYADEAAGTGLGAAFKYTAGAGVK